MPSDRSRVIDRPGNGYIAPVAQQGRVILDRDFNAWQAYLGTRIADDALDFVGPCGTPDNGFAISLPPASPPGAVWSPPAPESPPAGIGQGNDFLIAGGTMYLGGQRVAWPVTQNGKAIGYSYADQPELPAPGPAFVPEIFHHYTHELVYLDVTLQEVSATEDPDLLDVALGGPDTTQRLRQRARVERQGVDSATCVAAWTAMLALWAAQGLDFDPATMRLFPAVKLKVGFTQDASTGNPCDPVASGGYLGADNQLIRVRVAGDMLVWGYDNASFLYRVASISADRKTLTLASAPPDAFHYPQTGQIVEILGTSAVIGEEPDVSGLPGAPPIIRVAAQPNGAVCALTQPYGPTVQGDPTNYIVLDTSLPPSFTANGLPLFLRVWQAELPLVLNAPIVLEDPATGISTGIEVTLSGAKAAADGAYWQIAVRPSTPQGVYPEDLLTTPQPADGPLRFACPLAVIDWLNESGPVLTDCRNKFDNLVALSKRKPGCCTITIAPAQVTGRVTLQTLIDGAVASGNTVKICLAPGTYAMRTPLLLNALHDGLTIESCGGVATLSMAPTADASLFISGVIGLNEAAGVTLSGLSIAPPVVPLPAAYMTRLTSRLATAHDKTQVSAVLRSPSTCVGIQACDAQGLTLQGCGIVFPANTDMRLDLIAAGLFLQGDCSGLTVRDCNFSSLVAPSYNAIAQNNDYTNLVAKDRLNFVAPVVEAAAANQAAPAAAQESGALLQNRMLDIAPTIQGAAGAAPTQAPAPPPPAPPPPTPASFNATQEIFSGAALAKLLSSRDAGSVISLQRPMIASCGILAMTYGLPAAETNLRGAEFAATLTSCVLDNAVIQGNTFTALTFGAFTVGNTSLLRFQDNNIGGGVAGFWYAVSDTFSPSNLQQGTDNYYNTITEFEEFQALIAVSSILPPPDTGRVLRERIRKPAPAGVYATLMVSNNHIVTGPHPPPQPRFDARTVSSTLLGSAAVLLWLDSQASETSGLDTEISVLVTGNHMLTCAVNEPSALLVLGDGQHCAVSGNVIVNQPGFMDSARPSLWLVISNSAQSTEPVAASGNVLNGSSDLAYLNRAGGASRSGWSGYNADPF